MIPALLVAIGDPALGEVVGRHLDDDLVARQDPDVVHPDLSRDGAHDDLAVLELDVEHGIGEGLYDLALKLNCVLFAHAGHLSYLLTATVYPT